MSNQIQILYILIIAGLFILPFQKLQAQECPFGIENCKGQCGRFIDTDGDGYCDYTIITEIKDTTIVTENIQQENNTIQHQNQLNTENTEDSTLSDTNYFRLKSSNVHDINPSDHAKQSVKGNSNNTKKHGYRFLLWTLLTFGAYFLSIILYRTGIIKKRTHRRIWNGLLLITFLVSGILGLVLVIQINYQVFFDYFFTFLQWHVDFGIAMAWIAIFHVIWHFKYFRNIFKGGYKHTPEC